MADGQAEGFTLLEIMVAVAIISIVLVGVYRMHSQSIAMNYSTMFYSTAPMLAQSKLADFDLKPVDERTDDSGDFGDQFPGFNWQITVEDVESESLGSTADDLKKIGIAVVFNEGELSYRFSTYRYMPE